MLDPISNQDCHDILKIINLNKFKKKKILILGGNSFLASYVQAVLSFVNCKIDSVSLNKHKGILKKINNKNLNFIQADLNDEKK